MSFKLVYLQKSAKNFNGKVAPFVPHPFLLAILFTFIAYFLGIFLAYQGPFDMVKFWVNGFWSFLAFAMQMVLMVLTGFSVASVPMGRKIFRFLAAIPRNPRQAIMFVVLVSAFSSWIHWGIGMVTGSFLAREIGRRMAQVDYPLLVASAYIGMVAGSFGLFVPGPLEVSRAGHLLEKTMGVIPLSQTSFSAVVLTGSILGILIVTYLLGLICPGEKEAVHLEPTVWQRFEEEDIAEEAGIIFEKNLREKGNLPLGTWLEHSRWPVWLMAVMGFSFMVYWFYGRGFDLNLNILNFILLLLALALHETPMRFLKSMERSARPIFGIIVQFPFYAGIQGMLTSSGLATILFKWFISFSTAATFPIWVYLNAAMVNLFVPTSEGIWDIQGPLMANFGRLSGGDLARAINAFTAGEVMGNLIQPFWAIPILGICGLSMRDIMGYCLLAFSLLSLIWIFGVTFLPI